MDSSDIISWINWFVHLEMESRCVWGSSTKKEVFAFLDKACRKYLQGDWGRGK